MGILSQIRHGEIFESLHQCAFLIKLFAVSYDCYSGDKMIILDIIKAEKKIQSAELLVERRGFK
jgi:hypothetical protein